MERSRRSHHNKPYKAFSQFERHAYSVAQAKYQRKTIGQRIASMLKPLKQAMKNTAEK